MALNPARSSLQSRLRTIRRCKCPRTDPFAPPSALSKRSFSTSPVRQSDAQNAVEQRLPEKIMRPRWSYTPERMMKPFSLAKLLAKDPRRTVWVVNEDPARLDEMYIRLLGTNGDRILPDEIKWLAITHKSYDQGRRGFNARLAYYGRSILALQATRSIITNPSLATDPVADPHEREPFRHPALAAVDKLAFKHPQDYLDMEKMATLAANVGIPEVMRWKPRLPENLENSGIRVVLSTCLYAIVGAVGLQHGAEVAERVAQDKILKRLGA